MIRPRSSRAATTVPVMSAPRTAATTISVAPGWAWPGPLRPQRADRRHLRREAALYEPNPRRVSSRDLLARRSFVPVPHLNVLVPAWLQFMVHDWLSHGGGEKRRSAAPPPAAARRRLDPRRDDHSADPAGRSPLSRGPGPACDLSQHRDALVGRLPDLRVGTRTATPGPHRPGHRPSARRRQDPWLDERGHLPVDRNSDVPNLRSSSG